MRTFWCSSRAANTISADGQPQPQQQQQQQQQQEEEEEEEDGGGGIYSAIRLQCWIFAVCYSSP
jgi:hypothetical protein